MTSHDLQLFNLGLLNMFPKPTPKPPKSKTNNRTTHPGDKDAPKVGNTFDEAPEAESVHKAFYKDSDWSEPSKHRKTRGCKKELT